MLAYSAGGHEMADNIHPIEIAKDTYWVGKRDPQDFLHANPYLRVFQYPSTYAASSTRTFNCLIDPGSQNDFSIVSQKITRIIGGMDKTSAIFINHQDPDVGSITPKILARYAPSASVVCSESTYRLARHTGLTRKNLILTDHAKNNCLRLPTGHRLQFVPSPYVHAVGAVMLYDPETRVLFTGDFFGGLSQPEEGRIEACNDDWKGVRAFHQIYMPSNVACRRVMDAIHSLEPFPEVLAPQHGYVVRGALLHEWMERMVHLPCGLDILESHDREELQRWNTVLDRVLLVVRTMVASDIDVRLAARSDLQPHLSLLDGVPRITRMGRQTFSRVIHALMQDEPQATQNAICMEAIQAANLADLPTPDLPIENMGDTFEDYRRDLPTVEMECIELSS